MTFRLAKGKHNKVNKIVVFHDEEQLQTLGSTLL